MEYISDVLSFTIGTGPTRKTVAFTDSAMTSSHYIGTTSVALNRASAPLALAGISSIGIRDTSAAYDVTLGCTSSTTLTGAKTLTIDMVNVSSTIKLGYNLSLTAAATIGGTNTGDVSLATDHGLSLTGQVLAMGTPSTCTAATTNAVTTTTHTHAITGFLTAVTAHNILSTTHGDSTASACARGSLIIGDSNTKWINLAFPATPTGKYLNATATDVAWSTYALSLAGTLTTAGAFSTAGAYAMTLTATNTTSVTLPTSGTLVASVTTGNGVSATNTAGALAFTLGAITPTAVNGLAVSLGTNSISGNVAIGDSVLDAANSGTGRNVGIGGLTLHTNTSGNYNVGIGYHALYSNSTGNQNVALGIYAGTASTGSNNVFLGAFAGAYETGSGAFYVDTYDRSNTAGDKAGALLYGVFNATPASQTLKINATVTVSTLAGSGSRNVVADANGALSAPASDERLKTNITRLGESIPLAMLEDERIGAINYNWKDEGKGAYVELGFTAQMFEGYGVNGLAFEDDGVKGINYEKLTAILWEQNRQLLRRIKQLETK